MMNDIEICSTALIKLGADEISTFEDETREAKLCNRIYELAVRTCLSDRNWYFSQNQIELNRLSNVPLYKYTSAFQLPTDYLRLVGKENPSLPHAIHENYLYCDAQEIKITYVFRASEEKFPAYFTTYLVDYLCRELAIALMEDERKAAYYENKTIASRKRAGLIDSQSNGDTRVPFGSFYSVLAVRV
jgi:hypothetical protein